MNVQKLYTNAVEKGRKWKKTLKDGKQKNVIAV